MKNLSKEEPHKSYFKKESEIEETVDEAGRELKPLDPFVISGGQNTERFYFKAVSELTDYHFNVLPEYFGKESQYITEFSSRIKIITDGDPDAKIFCVFDLDTIVNDTTNKKNYEKFKLAIRDQIDSGTVTLCPSMPCFEYWLLLHFKNITTRMKNNACVTSLLKFIHEAFISQERKIVFQNAKKPKAFGKHELESSHLFKRQPKTSYCNSQM